MQYYFSLIKTKNLFLFSFFPNKDYNSRIIKIFFFFFYFGVNFTLNALFYNDSTMHKIYEEKGSFNIIYQIPKMIYSIFLSTILNIMIKFLSFSGDDIFKLKHHKIKFSKSFDKILIGKIYQKIKTKYFFFFIITPTVLFIFWYYITCFCGIYKNTQIHLLKETFSSFLISLIYPLFTAILPAIFRRKALNDKEKNGKCLFTLSKLFEYI